MQALVHPNLGAIISTPMHPFAVSLCSVTTMEASQFDTLSLFTTRFTHSKRQISNRVSDVSRTAPGDNNRFSTFGALPHVRGLLSGELGRTQIGFSNRSSTLTRVGRHLACGVHGEATTTLYWMVRDQVRISTNVDQLVACAEGIAKSRAARFLLGSEIWILHRSRAELGTHKHQAGTLFKLRITSLLHHLAVFH
jgi:hypothetical protein